MKDKFINSLILNYQNCMNEDKMNCQSSNGIVVTKKNIYYILKRSKWLYLNNEVLNVKNMFKKWKKKWH